MKLVLVIVAMIFCVVVVLWLVGWWSVTSRIRKARVKYGTMLPILEMMQSRTNDARLRPGYRKWPTQIDKTQVRGVFEDPKIDAIELPDGQIWTRSDLVE